MIELTEDERDWIADVWDEDTTASAGAFYPVVARIIAARLASAWDHGYQAAYLFERGEVYPEPRNPHRIAVEETP